MQNLSYENQFSSKVHSNANQTHFHMKGFALELVLKKRQMTNRKWPISTVLLKVGIYQVHTPKFLPFCQSLFYDALYCTAVDYTWKMLNIFSPGSE